MIVRRIFDKADVPSFCKTSGKRGLHIYVPLGQKYSHPHAKMLGEIIQRKLSANSNA